MFEDFVIDYEDEYYPILYNKQAFIMVRNGTLLFPKNIGLITHVRINGDYISIFHKKVKSLYKYPETSLLDGPEWDLHIVNEIYKIIEEMLEMQQFAVVSATDVRKALNQWHKNLI